MAPHGSFPGLLSGATGAVLILAFLLAGISPPVTGTALDPAVVSFSVGSGAVSDGTPNVVLSPAGKACTSGTSIDLLASWTLSEGRSGIGPDGREGIFTLSLEGAGDTVAQDQDSFEFLGDEAPLTASSGTSPLSVAVPTTNGAPEFYKLTMLVEFMDGHDTSGNELWSTAVNLGAILASNEGSGCIEWDPDPLLACLLPTGSKMNAAPSTGYLDNDAFWSVAGIVETPCQSVPLPLVPAGFTWGDLVTPPATISTTHSCVQTAWNNFHLRVDGVATIQDARYHGRIPWNLIAADVSFDLDSIGFSSYYPPSVDEDYSLGEGCTAAGLAHEGTMQGAMMAWVNTQLEDKVVPVHGYIGYIPTAGGQFVLKLEGDGVGHFHSVTSAAGVLTNGALGTTEWSFTAEWSFFDTCVVPDLCASGVVAGTANSEGVGIGF